MKTLEERLLDILKLLADENLYTEEDLLTKDYAKEKIFDSINFVNLIIKIENEFDIEIEDEYLMLEKLSNFNELVKVIKFYRGEE